MVTTVSRPFYMPPVVHFGENAAQEAGREARRFGTGKALVVTDKVLMEIGVVQPVLDSLTKEGVETVVYDGVDSEPTLAHVEEGLEIYGREKCDVIVAAGGGSSIDTSKAVRAMTANPGRIQDYMGIGKITEAGPPMIAVPTTAGTGSEASMFTIISDTENDVKMLIGAPAVVPSAALIDPLMTIKMPRSLTAATGLDALTHAIEAYVSVKAQPMSDMMALSAIRLLGEYLPQAWANPDNPEARSKTLLGSFQAGIAFSNASVALVHGMSRPIGALFHVAHGVSNAALLGVVMDFSLMGAPRRYAEVAEALGEPVSGLSPLEAAQRGADKVKRMIKLLEIPTLTEMGVSEEKLDSVVAKMADDAIASGSPANNPRKATKQEIVDLYYQAL